ncbi:MAG TPA: Clp protease ClpS [Planctomycetaceae bacterium]|nr:Clp protease ClpS [Planctomycetaceae bacterium]HRE99449.1 ATP-dependent Clp protease adaptor ClpS [Pirellulaceae bacterium]
MNGDSTTLDRSEAFDQGTAVAVATPERRNVPDKAHRPKKQPRYHVVLWDDDDHTYGYVIDMLRKLFGYEREKAFAMAEQVDRTGRTICVTTSFEVAELKRDQIRAYGSDPLAPECRGSMRATIEEAPE